MLNERLTVIGHDINCYRSQAVQQERVKRNNNCFSHYIIDSVECTVREIVLQNNGSGEIPSIETNKIK